MSSWGDTFTLQLAMTFLYRNSMALSDVDPPDFGDYSG